MTEIPEHLLKRSKAAKASKSGEEAPSGDDGGSSAAPVAAEKADAPVAAAPAAADLPNLDPEPEPPKPEPAFVTASKARRRIPVWAMPVVAALPVWAWSYAGTMQQPPVEDPVFVESEALYGDKGCSGCHGATGGGGNGYAFSNGEVMATFPEPIDQMVHVARGSSAIAGEEYGAERADGRRVSGARGNMPPQIDAGLTQLELEMVVFHERAVLGGEEHGSPEYEAWMEHMREAYEEGDATPIDLQLLLDCANPEYTPGATGVGAPDEDHPCPGPAAPDTEEVAAG